MLANSNRVVTGYHGTSVQGAAAIVHDADFQLSQNDYDWIGHGLYFWEHAPYRAWEWARQKYVTDAAVVEAEIELGHCLDLTDIRYTRAVRLAFDGLREAYAARSMALPVNRGKARRLDCLVINYVAEYVFPECETVRAPFLEGLPILEGSGILSSSRIQIVVRKPRGAIKSVRLARKVEEEEA